MSYNARMNTSDKKSLANPLRQVTLAFLIRDKEILLAMKKRGVGEGKWNGYGGKPMIDETIIDAAIRETREEIGVTPKELKHVATLNFYFPALPQFADSNQQVIVFFVRQWEGEIQETEEMAPEWFPLAELPFSKMWPDDIHWLPKVIQGNNVTADFYFNKDMQLDNFSVREV